MLIDGRCLGVVHTSSSSFFTIGHWPFPISIILLRRAGAVGVGRGWELGRSAERFALSRRDKIGGGIWDLVR